MHGDAELCWFHDSLCLNRFDSVRVGRSWASRSLSTPVRSPQQNGRKMLAPRFICSSGFNVPPAGVRGATLANLPHVLVIPPFFLQRESFCSLLFDPPAAVIEPQQHEAMAVTPSDTLGWFAARMMPAEGQSPLRQFSKVFNEGLIMVSNEIPKWEVKAGEEGGSSDLATVPPTLTSLLRAGAVMKTPPTCGRESDQMNAETWGRLHVCSLGWIWRQRSSICPITCANTGRRIHRHQPCDALTQRSDLSDRIYLCF